MSTIVYSVGLFPNQKMIVKNPNLKPVTPPKRDDNITPSTKAASKDHKPHTHPPGFKHENEKEVDLIRPAEPEATRLDKSMFASKLEWEIF